MALLFSNPNAWPLFRAEDRVASARLTERRPQLSASAGPDAIPAAWPRPQNPRRALGSGRKTGPRAMTAHDRDSSGAARRDLVPPPEKDCEAKYRPHSGPIRLFEF